MENDIINNINNNLINDQTEKITLNSMQNVPIVEKKKRGRKPKNLLLQSTNCLSNDLSMIQSDDLLMDKSTNKLTNQLDEQRNNKSIDNVLNIKSDIGTIKKRGRKANAKIIDVSQESNVDIVTNLIAYLPLKTSDINKIINQSETMNNLFDISDQINQTDKINTLSELNLDKGKKYVDFTDESIDDIIKYKSKTNEICVKCKTYEQTIIKLEKDICNLKNGIMDCMTNFNKKIYESKVNFIDKNTNTWTDKTDIACWWCCHKFNHIPMGIPEFINKNKYYVYGCFCSFNCMIAYNLDLNDSKIWDRQANIYRMKNFIDSDNKFSIHPAPSRQCLSMFGGPLSIETFRESFFIINKEFRCIFPPMISIVGIIEEDNRDLTGQNFKIKSEQQIIRRRKPLPKQLNNLNSIISKVII